MAIAGQIEKKNTFWILRRSWKQSYPLAIASFLNSEKHKFRFYYTPKHAPWMNQIEIWFGIVMKKVIKRRNFTSTVDLKNKLLAFVDYFNKTMARPYNWKYAGEVLKN